ncbi:tetratricopeptide repeat protein [Modestobacter versicolor]|uniref:Uncharacterized protein n=1 Tax=Modestobacter versicolor TaxID=429133 RepID=A0A839Y915_9ACTN|nr:tetratricopeptide repeat protein [Modestobacter versicolor]MBB3676804.1 hypothetical protein [Modestobacter versicolor]
MWTSRRRDPDHLEALSLRQLGRWYRRVPVEIGADAGSDRARAELLDRIQDEWLRRLPGDPGMLNDRAMHAKWRRDWPTAQALGELALAALPTDQREGEPAAWNLGIAATARRDWAVARRAWQAFGIPVSGEGDAPVDEDLGPAPVRLNPPPRFVGQQEVLVDGRAGEPEVVWGRRLDPTRIQLVSVPLPASGHRYGDVMLHDGDVQGTRRFGDQEIGVFNEIELWERSPRPTLSAVVTAGDADSAQLEADLEAAGLAGEDWTTNMRVLCAACSNGSPGAHDHPGGAAVDGQRTFGLSGHPDDVAAVLRAWVAAAPGRAAGELTVELE